MQNKMKTIYSIIVTLLITILYSLFLTYLHIFLGMSLFSLQFYIIFVSCGALAAWFLTQNSNIHRENKKVYGVLYSLIVAILGGFILGYLDVLNLLIFISLITVVVVIYFNKSRIHSINMIFNRLSELYKLLEKLS
jgi:hypothetical protein